VVERFFEERYYNRMTMPTVLTRLGRAFEVERGSIAREHLRVGARATQAAVHPGNRFTLFVNIIPVDGAHVYGPAVGGGYQGLEVVIDPLPYLTAHPARYPDPVPLRLGWTDEVLAGYGNPVRVAVDVSLGTRLEMAAVIEAGQELTITGTVRVQACDDRVCWAPEAIPLAWHLDLIPPDLERSPESLQHKPKA
jgi:DsbC/DsbD-like thiol-disulfide interchange protein